MIGVDGQGPVAKDARIVELLRSAYEAELRSESMFALMLEHGGPASLDQQGKIEACRLLEIDMSALLSDHITLELGLPLRRPQDPAATVPPDPTAIHCRAWPSRMAAVEAVAVEDIAAFRDLKALYADRQPMLCNTLLAHALMIRDFARREADGETEDSLRGVLSLLSPGAREALARFEATNGAVSLATAPPPDGSSAPRRARSG